MAVGERFPLVDEVLGGWKDVIGRDYVGYRNHVYRMIHFCVAQLDCSGEVTEKIIIAGCFHDLGIWSNRTFDYLPPSVALAKDYLSRNGLEDWIPEIELMISTHHKLGRYDDETNNPLVEVFRRGDLVDFSLGLVKWGLPKTYIKGIQSQFPNAGFHRCLVRVASGWFLKHPLNPLPVVKW